MRIRAAYLILCVMPLVGCGTGNLVNPVKPSPDLSGNWEFGPQVSLGTGSLPVSGVLLVGSLISQGSNVTAIFRLANLPLNSLCGVPLQQVVNLSGSIDASRNVTLTSAPFANAVLTMKFFVPPVPVLSPEPFPTANGTVAIVGGTCPLPSTALFGFEIGPVTGTFAGLVTSSYPPAPPIPSGTASLTMTQAALPQFDGQFPVSGTLTFSGGGCSSSIPVAGTVGGAELTIASAPTGIFNLSINSLGALVNAANGDLSNAILRYGNGPCNAGAAAFSLYTGTLSKQ